MSFDVYVTDVAARRTRGSPSAGTMTPGIRSTGRSTIAKLLVVEVRTRSSESYLYIADVASGALTPLDKSNRKIGIRAARFAPDGRGVYVVSDEDGEFAQLRYVDIVTHESRKLTAHVPWDIESFDVSADGRYIAYVANQRRRSRLTVVDNTQKLELCRRPGIPEGRIYDVRFDRAGRPPRLLRRSRAGAARCLRLRCASRTSSSAGRAARSGPVDARTFVSAELIRYPTWDRVDGRPRMISAYRLSAAHAAARIRWSSIFTAARSRSTGPTSTPLRSFW